MHSEKPKTIDCPYMFLRATALIPCRLFADPSLHEYKPAISSAPYIRPSRKVIMVCGFLY